MAFNDPLFVALPDHITESGFFAVPPSPLSPSVIASLHYEVRGRKGARHVVLLTMGSFATKKHFEQLADVVASQSVDICAVTYDHRGIGRSTCNPRLNRQSTDLLAEDGLALLQYVFPRPAEHQRFHVMGISLGGMVAQKILLRSLREPKIGPALSSLYCAVTPRGNFLLPYLPMPVSLVKLGFSVSKLVASAVDMDTFLGHLARSNFSNEYVTSVHPNAPNGETMEQLWRKAWSGDAYADWWAFADSDACASQASAAASHYLSDKEVDAMVASRVPITVYVAEKDGVISPREQERLAQALHATIVRTQGGHVIGIAEEFQVLVDTLIRQILSVQ